MESGIFTSRGARRLRFWSVIDWPLLSASLILSLFGLVTMFSFSAENSFFEHQIVWLAVSLGVFILASFVDYRFLRQSWPVAALYGLSILSLILVFIFGTVTKGAQSRFDLGFFAVQPADIVTLVLIIVLAKYFARRHIDIAQFRHIIVSGVYALVPFLLLVLQPDLGSALILGFVWLGMVLVSGISKKHLTLVFVTAALTFAGLWYAPIHHLFNTEEPFLHEYQKQRVLTFLNPLADIQGTGYNAYQSVVAVGSGGLTGKGIGYGTQSKLRFLPEYQTDFIFAAFAEEWGLLGVVILFALYLLVVWRIMAIAFSGGSNFETLFAIGFACFIIAHFVVHVGINIGLLPVTGTTIPFMSYGGSHLIVEYLGLGMLMGMRRYSRIGRSETAREEFAPSPTIN